MPRKSSSSGRSAPRPAPKPLKQSPPPPAKTHAAPPPAPLQSSGGGSVLGSIGGAIADGMAFGTGSAIAHRVVDSVMGPRVVQHEHTTVSNAAPAAGPVTSSMSSGVSSMSDSCTSQAKAFQDCITANGSDIGKCQFYLDMLNECKKTPKSPTVGF